MITTKEFDKILNICYTTRVEVVTKRNKRVMVERQMTVDEIAHQLAHEFGFTLISHDEDNKNE